MCIADGQEARGCAASASRTPVQVRHKSTQCVSDTNELRPDRLRLLQRLVRSDNLLSFQMVHCPRNNPLRYTAISYVWGDELPTETILINGQPFSIRPNLWNCLFELTRFWSHLWLDAICINQDNNEERSQQVRLMDQIYSRSAEVSVWLGSTGSPWPDSILPTSSEMDDWEHHAYWRRYWVIQEFLLGPQVKIYRGRISSHSVRYIAHLGNYERKVQPVPWSLLVGRHSTWYPGKGFDEDLLDDEKDIYRKKKPLCELLLTHMHCECKDPRDRVFALLGLLNSTERVWLERFFPDYSLAEDDVVTIALAHIRTYRPTCSSCDHHKIPQLLQSLGVDDEDRTDDLICKALDFDYTANPPAGPDGQKVRAVLKTTIDVKRGNWGRTTQRSRIVWIGVAYILTHAFIFATVALLFHERRKLQRGG